MATVYIPAPIRRITSGHGKVTATGATVRDVLNDLERQYPGVRSQLFEPGGEVRSFINVFVNGTEIRQLQGLNTPVKDADEVSIIPAMAGGQHGTTGLETRDWGTTALCSYESLVPRPQSRS
jgi:molybdopterin synthase sulfur carrier subunit